MPQRKVFNIPRVAAENFRGTPGSVIWISIEEPGEEKKTRVHNPALEGIPTLRIALWDITEPVPLIGTGNHAYPPSEKDAHQILSFILANPNKHILVNCAAGVSRSGAVAAFCEKTLGYLWPEDYKKHADPNRVLLQELTRCFEEIQAEELKYGAKDKTDGPEM